MAKRFRAGMFGGKFMPYHLGHYYCLQTASRMCDKVYQILMAGGVDEEKILAEATELDKAFLTVEARLEAMRAAGERLGNVETILMDISQCRTPDNQEDWDAETPMVLAACGHFDAVFGSEPHYGAYFSRAYPWATYILVDPPRIVVPISGTMVRAMDDTKAKEWMA